MAEIDRSHVIGVLQNLKQSYVETVMSVVAQHIGLAKNGGLGFQCLKQIYGLMYIYFF